MGYQAAGQQFLSFSLGSRVERAMSVPTISRARDLICSMIGGLELSNYTKEWTGDGFMRRPLEPMGWMDRPDPQVTRNWIMAQTVSDLFFHGRAFWYVASRYQTGFPASFQWLPAANVSTPGQAGPYWMGPASVIELNGVQIPTDDVVQFLSPVAGVVTMGARAIDIAVRLDDAARRFALNQTPAGYLQQTGGEPMNGDELAELASAWAEARTANAVGALNEAVEWREFDADPSKLQLTEGRQHSSLELSRVANIPPYLVGVSVGGYTYQNAQQARQDLYLFGARPFIECVEQTLSLDSVTPRGRVVEFDIDAYLAENAISDANIREEMAR